MIHNVGVLLALLFGIIIGAGLAMLSPEYKQKGSVKETTPAEEPFKQVEPIIHYHILDKSACKFPV